MPPPKWMMIALALLVAPTLRAGEAWLNLFNGHDLAGWIPKAGDAKFYVADGCLVGEAVSESETNSVLATAKDYANFILELDFQADHQLFSGVHIRSQYAARETPWQWDGRPLTIPAGHVYGYLVLIDPSPNHRWWTASLYDERWWSGGVYDELRRMWLYPGLKGGDNDEFSRQGQAIFHPNHWNHLRISAEGSLIQTWLNGVLCAHFNDSLSPSGFIGLQVRDWISDDDHENLVGARVRFKNLRLQLLAHPLPTPNPP